MKPIRTLIVDDEPLARENLRIRLRDLPDFDIVGECGNGGDALAQLSRLEPELLFIDIQMPDLDGFEVIEQVPAEVMPVIVFVTAYDRYALDAFRVHALDYLLKPFDDDRFAETLRLARERIALVRQAAAGPGEPLYQLAGTPGGGRVSGSGEPARGLDRLVIKARGRVFFLKVAAIDWVEANGDYACLHAGNRSYLLRRTMQEMEARLGALGFVRVSRGAIVNLDRIRELRPAARGEFLIRLECGQEVKLTRGYRERLEEMLGDRL
jgi:two-component system LytT family response regulator